VFLWHQLPVIGRAAGPVMHFINMSGSLGLHRAAFISLLGLWGPLEHWSFQFVRLWMASRVWPSKSLLNYAFRVHPVNAWLSICTICAGARGRVAGGVGGKDSPTHAATGMVQVGTLFLSTPALGLLASMENLLYGQGLDKPLIVRAGPTAQPSPSSWLRKHC
jgi:hypothetical protein